MARSKLNIYEIKCDGCPAVQKIVAAFEPNVIKDWTVVKYSEEGGGHYGFPHHHFSKDYCPNCKSKAIASDCALSNSVKIETTTEKLNYLNI